MKYEGPMYYEQYEDRERSTKMRRPRHTSFLDDDTKSGKFFQRKKNRIVKKSRKP